MLSPVSNRHLGVQPKHRFGDLERTEAARIEYEASEAELLHALAGDFDRTYLTRRAAEVSEKANRWEGAALDASVRLRTRASSASAQIGEIEAEAQRAAAVRDLWWRMREALLGQVDTPK